MKTIKLLVLSLLFILISCNDKEETETPETENPQGTGETEGETDVTFSYATDYMVIKDLMEGVTLGDEEINSIEWKDNVDDITLADIHKLVGFMSYSKDVSIYT